MGENKHMAIYQGWTALPLPAGNGLILFSAADPYIQLCYAGRGMGERQELESATFWQKKDGYSMEIVCPLDN